MVKMAAMVEPMSEPSEPVYVNELSKEQRQRFIEQWRIELRRLDREYEAVSKEDYRRAGIPPLPNWGSEAG